MAGQAWQETFAVGERPLKVGYSIG